jgi:beta-phosphoglucomutase-like phosphatase (HAD superfamily)
MTALRAVLFDLDGTLLDTAPSADRLSLEAFIEPPPDLIAWLGRRGSGRGSG